MTGFSYFDMLHCDLVMYVFLVCFVCFIVEKINSLQILNIDVDILGFIALFEFKNKRFFHFFNLFKEFSQYSVCIF